jgi:transketolase C-terminal domain/subunit
MDKVLINSNKYDGKYVALKDAEDTTIVGSGNTPEEALNEAKSNGISNPFILYVPDKDLVHIYYVS